MNRSPKGAGHRQKVWVGTGNASPPRVCSRPSITTVDLIFSSSSAAATYVAGSNRSGNATWRTNDGTLLEDLG